MTEAEKRNTLELMAREAKRLEEVAGTIGEDFLAYLLASVQQEIQRAIDATASEARQ